MDPTRLAFLFAIVAATPACFSTSTETGNPPVVETALVHVTAAPQEGQVIVEGDAGAVSPGGGRVTVKNGSTGQEASAEVADDGSFSLTLDGSPDDDYTISASGPGDGGDGSGASTPKPIGRSAQPGTGDWQLAHRCTGNEPSDALVVDAVAIDGDTLEVTVSHGGGCEQHAYGLCWDDAWNESYPVQNGVRVLHDAMGDNCDAYFTETVHFDLTPYRREYEDLYRSEFGAISMSVAACADGADCSVLYDFECPAGAGGCP